MSDQLKVGDRVKIVPDKDGQIYTGVGLAFYPKQAINGLEGEVKYVDDAWGSAHIQTDKCGVLNVCLQCLTRIERPRRTYEEIIEELAEKLKGTEIHHYIDRWGNVTFSAPSDYMGELDVEIEYTADQLAAISAACTEIADNYAAEIGKEEER